MVFCTKGAFPYAFGRFPLNTSVKVIPTFVVPSGHRWKPQVLEFAKKNNAKTIVMKRELSDGGNHVLKMDTNALEHLKGRHEFRRIAQPFFFEFSEHPEMRMYVIDGKCTFGCMTRFVDKPDGSRHMSTVATTPGRRTWLKEGGQEAAAAAEHVVQIIARDQAHALRFLRVDLIRRNDGSGGWWLNELEYFGNAHILEGFDHASELLDLILNDFCFDPNTSFGVQMEKWSNFFSFFPLESKPHRFLKRTCTFSPTSNTSLPLLSRV